MCHLLHIGHVHIKVRINFSAAECLLFFLNSFVYLRFQLILKLRYFLSISNPNIANCTKHRVSFQQLKHAFLLKKHIEFFSTLSFIAALTEVESWAFGL